MSCSLVHFSKWSHRCLSHWRWDCSPFHRSCRNLSWCISSFTWYLLKITIFFTQFDSWLNFLSYVCCHCLPPKLALSAIPLLTSSAASWSSRRSQGNAPHHRPRSASEESAYALPLPFLLLHISSSPACPASPYSSPIISAWCCSSSAALSVLFCSSCSTSSPAEVSAAPSLSDALLSASSSCPMILTLRLPSCYILVQNVLLTYTSPVGSHRYFLVMNESHHCHQV